MTCDGNVGGASNVCVVKVQNSALTGPFGGSAAKKRAIEYRLKRRHIARSTVGMAEEA